MRGNSLGAEIHSEKGGIFGLTIRFQKVLRSVFGERFIHLALEAVGYKNYLKEKLFQPG